MHLLEQNQHKINWYELCANPNAIELIKQNMLHYVRWDKLSTNPSAIELLEESGVCVYNVWANPAIFEENDDNSYVFK
jgi:hypothetical protein